MQPTTATLIVAGLGIAGTFGSGVMAQRMARRFDRERWLRDQRVVEWRELLTAISDSLRAAQKLYPVRKLTAEEDQVINEMHSNTFRVIRDRIFIAPEMQSLDIERRWGSELQEYSRTLDAAKLGAVYTQLRKDIVDSARQSFEH